MARLKKTETETVKKPKAEIKKVTKAKPKPKTVKPDKKIKDGLKEASEGSQVAIQDRTGIGGRPRVTLTDEQVAKVTVLASVLSEQQIADYFGFSKDTFTRMRKRDPRLLRAYNQGLAEAVALVGEGVIQKALRGDARAAEFFLKTRGGWKEQQQIDHTNSDGNLKPPPTIKIVHIDSKTLKVGSQNGSTSTVKDRQGIRLSEGDLKE